MGYYKPSIERIINEAAPKEKRPKFQLTEKQLEVVKTISGVVLGVAIVAGTIVLSAMAPNIFVALDKIFGKGGRRANSGTYFDERTQRVTKAIYYLKSKEYIKLVPQGKDFLVKITQKGRIKTRKFQIDAMKLNSQGNWDGKWWVFIADVPIEYRRRADLFREKIKELGLHRLQKTVWFYPFDVRDEIDFIAAYYHLGNYVTVMRADMVDPEDAKALKNHFRQSKII